MYPPFVQPAPGLYRRGREIQYGAKLRSGVLMEFIFYIFYCCFLTFFFFLVGRIYILKCQVSYSLSDSSEKRFVVVIECFSNIFVCLISVCFSEFML
jgi:hypothetical protein